LNALAVKWKRPEGAERMAQISKTLPNLTFFIVDDNGFTRALTAEALRTLGATRIMAARTTNNAVEQFKTSAPDIILCEHDLGDSCGLTFTRRLRSGEFPVPRSLPVILLTFRNRTKDVEQARLVGVTEYAVRPFATQVLAERVESILLRPRPFINVNGYSGPCRRRRDDPDYKGPMRRASDETSMEPPQKRAYRAAATAKIRALQTVNWTVNNRLPSRVRGIYSIGADLIGICAKLEDVPLYQAAESLVSYVERFSRKDRFDPRIVDAHIDAMRSLLVIEDQAARAGIASELSREVARRCFGRTG